MSPTALRALALYLLYFILTTTAEILTPRYFNLALGKKITATATCGDEGLELYCKLVSSNADHDEQVIQGQVCDVCDATNSTKSHPPEYAVDGMETWWQSPPLSRGMKYNEVNLTIDLGQEFHVAYVFVRMGNSPRPGLWALEKSTDYGITFKPWQYFSDSTHDCEQYFGSESLQPITRDDSVICSTEYSKIVPLEGGEIPISLLKYRPSANKYFNSSVLQEWTRATNVRLRLMRTKNLLGHLMSVARQDPTVTRRYFYSIKDISIGGRCMCNGHADNCVLDDPESDTNILVCRCQHNTCGPQCAQCCPGFEQKKWRISQHWDRFSCEPCNCHNHSTKCVYDATVDKQQLSLDIRGRHEGGGVCQECQHNTEGINCNKCKSKFYRPYGKKWDEIDVCKPCNCDLHFSTGNCTEETGQCECRKEFQSPDCDACAYGYFDYPDCKPCTCNLIGTDGAHCTPTNGLCPCKFNFAGTSCEICADGYYSSECKSCECNTIGSVSTVCDKDSGNCTCKSKYAGRTCNQCEAGYYNYPTCSHCNCDTSGTLANICDDVTGQCICKEGFAGARCDQCSPGFYIEVRGRERVAVPCNCAAKGSTATSCLPDGKCNCLSNFGGKQCNQCSPGYYQYPDCLACNCDASGAIGASCNDAGQCHCNANFDGGKCERCREQFYNYPACEECNCDPRGVIASFAGCGSVPAGELCQCKDRVQGRICNDCKPLFWNLQEYNPLGCEECNCHLPGTLGGLGACDTRSGQCACKLRAADRRCDQCRDGFYRMRGDNLFGCTECDCDVGGSLGPYCDKQTGQCRCSSRVEGRRCDRPIRAHYFPTLHQFRYELEDGQTPSGAVRYRDSNDTFPNYSWKGYVVFSPLQNEVINVVTISKSSLYRMVMKYASPLQDPVVASVVVTPESVVDVPQTFSALLRPTLEPQLMTVAGERGVAPSPFVMNPGNWTVTIKTTREVMIDFFVLIPEAYYEATVLTMLVDKPCEVGDDSLCRQFAYPSVAGYPTADINNLATGVTKYIDNPQQLNELHSTVSVIPLLDSAIPLQFKLNIPPGTYAVLVEYVTPVDGSRLPPTEEPYTDWSFEISARDIVTVSFSDGGRPEVSGLVNFHRCPYSTACRQAVVDELSKVLYIRVEGGDESIYLYGEKDSLIGVKSVVAIPQDRWHLDYISPQPYCIRRNGQCAPAAFDAATVDAKRVEVESGLGGDRETRPPNLDNSTQVVYLHEGAAPLTVASRVHSPDDYVFAVHYYQPDHPESTIAVNLTTEQQLYQGQLDVKYCPSTAGCRGLIRASGRPAFPVSENFTITFETGPAMVWLDYVLVMAEPAYTDSVVRETNSLDYTQHFITQCATNHYQVDVTSEGFCRDSVFSITADYNSGTLRCNCDVEGSLDLECAQFGGQCRCRPNVIGRTCSACRTGFYGFPDCRPCNCPSTAICDDFGSCICPKNVVGANCTACKPYTFNFDPQRGCDDCNCNPLGVLDNQLQCDLDNGSCTCKESVIGRVCDHCVPGHYAFPECYQCHCNLDGTTYDVCDQNTAQCYCKKHVRGQACDVCRDEYFNLQPDNPEGCTSCFCFGRTTRCASAQLYWVEITGMWEWTLAGIAAGRSVAIVPLGQPQLINDTCIGAELGSEDTVVYFGAPNQYLGQRLTSYGGTLRYSVLYTAQDSGHAVPAPDIVLGGAGGAFLVHTSVEQPPSSQIWTHSVVLSEDEFTNLDGSPATRDQMMNILMDVSSLHIRATYFDKAVTTRLMGVSLDIAVDDWSNESLPALSVEQCQCPPQYRGLSCEQCAEGHYRLSTGPHAGVCVPCQCNRHSPLCDVNTGVCLNCLENTMGDHCEQCIPGYHGDATTGTPSDCLICACPMPYPSNNFAVGCELSSNGSLIRCDCKPGYGGPRCEFCAAGYYGDPETIDDHCKPCNCSGNINPEDPDSCDSMTGDCLKCVNNTAGGACNLCAPGFFGDAIFSKNCTACECDEYGMDHCDPSTGTCVCRAGVVAGRCDTCLPDHWGLSSGQGCTPCDCALASEAAQCDANSGQCRCAKGVTGRHCEQCAAGYWNYTKDGCDHCNCNSGYSVGFMCNATGQCECLPGVIGEKCDRCPERWVLIPNEGCRECDSCTDALLFSVEDLAALLANETQDFKDKADSFFTTQRLNYISNRTRALRPRTAELRNVDADDVTTAVQQLESQAKALLRSAEFAATDSEKQIVRADDLAAAADGVLASLREHDKRAQAVVKHVADLATGLELSQQPKVDSALDEARQSRNDIADKNLEPKRALAQIAIVNATEQLEGMNRFVEPVNEQNKKFEQLIALNRAMKEKLSDMAKFTAVAQDTATAAAKLNANNRASKFGTKVNSVSEQNTAAIEDLIDGTYSLSNASQLHSQALDLMNNSTKALEELNAVKAQLDGRQASTAQELPELQRIADEARHHAGGLQDRAESLRGLAERENNNTRTQHAYSAASAYSSIVQEIAAARRAADEAAAALARVQTTDEALTERASPASQRSFAIRDSASAAERTASAELRPALAAAEADLAGARDLLRSADDENRAIVLSLPGRPSVSLDGVAKADKVNATVLATLATMSQLGGDLAASKEFAQSLPKNADETINMAARLRSYLKDLEDTGPQIGATYSTVKAQQDDQERRRREADLKLQKLRDLIEQTRTVVDLVQVGVTFDSSSTLQPRLPDTVDEMSTNTHISAFFRTKEKNGLILYLGNPKGTMLRRTKSDDFMVLEIHNGYPYLVIDIGDGAESGRDPARIVSDKYVADNRWYQVIVDRVGRHVKLTVRESLGNATEDVSSKDAVLPGQHTVFNLDRKKSKLYVGGAPSDALSKLQGISYPAFEGEIEELMIGGTPVGLWNFASAANLKGAKQRDQLITKGPKEFRFNGRGYAKVPGRDYLDRDRNSLMFFFKTYAPDGLLYLVGDRAAYFAIRMQGGVVYLQVSTDDPERPIILGTKKRYNDGKWHKLDARRIQRVCSLKLDAGQADAEAAKAECSEFYIDAIDTMNFGGNNEGIPQLARQGFDGCIKDISSDKKVINVTMIKESVGVTYGCQFPSLVSLSGEDSYLRYVNVSTENLQLTLKFKTSSPDGLLFVYLGRTQTANMQDSVSLSLIKGKLVLTSQGDVLDTGLRTYNDSHWHVVTVTHGDTALRLVVDDFDYFSTDTAPAPLNILDGVLFVGGLKPRYTAKVGSKVPFKGCIADATINGRMLSLLEPFESSSAVYGRCGASTAGSISPDAEYWPMPPQQEDLLPVVTNAPATEPPRQPDATPAKVDYRFGSANEDVPPPAPTAPPAQPPAAAQPTAQQPAQPPKRAPPQPEQGCALAYDPYYVVGDPEEGYRFGTRNDSRIEYGRLPGRQHDGFDLTITLRTFDQHGGLIFYAHAEKSPAHFLALYMKYGKLHLAFNCGAETVVAESPLAYSGTEWHTVTVVRLGAGGKLSVDNELVAEASGRCHAPAALAPPFYYGGLRNLTADIEANLQNFYQPFKGCLKGLMMNGQRVNDVMFRVNALQCRDNVEDGYYFGPSKGSKTNYLKLKEKFRVGSEISIEIEIKPRNSTGLLLSVHGRKDFLVLELLENEVLVNVENGKGPFHASFKLGNNFSICDGQWHKIHVAKSRHVVSVGVDGHFSNAGLGQSGSTDTNLGLFVGGHERPLSRVPGVRSRRGYAGCIRNIVLKDVPVPVELNAAYGNVHVGVCPVN